jgi:hypothetical protein
MGAVWGIVEAVFGVYYQYLARSVQPAGPPSIIPLDQVTDLFSRVLRTGLVSTAKGDTSTGEHARDEQHVVASTAHAHASEVNVHLAGPGSTEPVSGNLQSLRERGRLRSAAIGVMGITEQSIDPDEDEDPLFDGKGNPHVFHMDDPLAIEFREHLRTW